MEEYIRRMNFLDNNNEVVNYVWNMIYTHIKDEEIADALAEDIVLDLLYKEDQE